MVIHRNGRKLTNPEYKAYSIYWDMAYNLTGISCTLRTLAWNMFYAMFCRRRDTGR